MPINLVGIILFCCLICCLYCSCWGRIKKLFKIEKFDNICDYYTGIGPNGCATKSYCTNCNNKSRQECAYCRNCVYVDGVCMPGDYQGPYDKRVDYDTYEYDIPYSSNIPERRQTDLRYDYKYKII